MAGYMVECKSCGKQELVDDGLNAQGVQVRPPQDPHVKLVCGCCPADHHHGQAADPVTGTGVPCRPITHYARVGQLVPVLGSGLV
ncbi:MAG TPA: hypothetical protein VGI66_01020 [Streptosporangiaceae bacterium]|jgi:hypothetical protein